MTAGRRRAAQRAIARFRRAGAAAWLLAAAVAAGSAATGCTQTVLWMHPDGHDAGTGGAAGADGGGDGVDAGPWTPWVCPNGQQRISLMPQTRWPEVIIALDRSSSMNLRFGDSGSRLSVAQQTLQKLVPSYQNAIGFGYEEFPSFSNQTRCFDSGGCCAGDVLVAPALQNGDAIDHSITGCSTMPSSCVISDASPTASALERIRDFYSRPDDHPSERYVLLLTDGEPTCSADGGTPDPAAICAQASYETSQVRSSEGAKTIVIGIGDDIAANTCLDNLALAGGRPRNMMAPFYYPARDPPQLTSTLGDIMTDLAKSACRINLGLPPSDPSTVKVTIFGQEVPHDGNNGWSLDTSSSVSVRMTITGTWCGMLQAVDPRGELMVTACPSGPGH